MSNDRLNSSQRDIVDSIFNNKNNVNVLTLSRKSGQTFTLLTLALEKCLNESNFSVSFIVPNKKFLERFVIPLLHFDVFKDEITDFKLEKNCYIFANGSVLKFYSSEKHIIDDFRGGKDNLIIIEDAENILDLNYIIKYIALPKCLNGKILICGNISKGNNEFNELVKNSGDSLIKRTVFDNKSMTMERLSEIVNHTGGIDSEEFRMYYMCEFIGNI